MHQPDARRIIAPNANFRRAIAICALFLPTIPITAYAQKTAPLATQYVSPDLLDGPTAVSKPELKQTTAKVGTFGTVSVWQDLITGQMRQIQGKIASITGVMTEPTAKQAIQSNIQALGAPKQGTDLQLISSSSSLSGSHVIYQQLFNGFPVFGGSIAVNTPTGSKGSGTIQNDLKIINKASEPSDFSQRDLAVAAALAAVHFTQGPKSLPTTDAGILAIDGEPVPVWRIRYRTQEPGATWEVMVRSSDSKVLSVRNISAYRQNSSSKEPQTASVTNTPPDSGPHQLIPPPRGFVFVPNPVQSTGKADFPDHLDGQSPGADFPAIENVRSSVAISYLMSGGHLEGTFASTAPSSVFTRATQADAIFEFTRSDQRFDEVMAYYWVTQSTLYAQSLGFPSINNRQLKLDVNGTTDDNSFYSDGTLTFGSGGIRDAEDAEVIFHETGHAIQDSQVPGIIANGGHDVRSMSEGFSDYWAASFFADIGPSAWNIFFDKWDGLTVHLAANGNPPYLRRLDTTKHYPEGIDGEVHDDGEIWSACLWKIRGILGRTLTDKLLLESNYSLTTNTTFTDAANIIVSLLPKVVPASGTSPSQLKLVRQVFVDRGILLN